MGETVWCVFQKLPNEKCPTLSAVCRTHAVAEAVCESSRREAQGSGEPEGEWLIREWSVLDAEAERRAEEADQISHVLDPMRAGVAVSEADADAEAGEAESPR
ncbi:MAG TPA: hypothetical protein VF746_08855 [Longimicrobium sp.]|jgi:hypothetical protein